MNTVTIGMVLTLMKKNAILVADEFRMAPGLYCHEVLRPLIEDLVPLEENGVSFEKLGASLKGTVLYVALTAFQQSFIVEKICRFCMAEKKSSKKCQLRFLHSENQRYSQQTDSGSQAGPI